ncbi:MAG TPA: tRNA uridine-5-carboxymethylaminomethyl(34) synthesis GTPase MnmE [Rhodocyclaceae bacterium]|nr:tRNA uridine-5-carboxymethylaminomethyl(34) synthesis GTPase MnmE [Rhodocyclaceae bacterium]HMV53071.1 tRNA uridine-5-carboxymethylaminomethyl(34) synthesis GTPase MnmE [Rhodocyclaceae bacterium]HMZ84213.1 tRNA uridine-5-carboxymethylaminomethyl(34) synthesis GTPase MnmE [Rhodocyclaceae bacterium]HNA04124.1 tRNA uridine-5-carboxymethylaminomethyl(34) synthesis GTPase MnmE [Rhodocyclaceae bacterium]HNB79705.1 tRNA uridine-5-carboxymethylaminomethyl(34) synthesis GTPase MnmE [Rhodocyclaceae ba
MARKSPPDIVAAIATAHGRGGIGVVRLSGPRLASIALALIGRDLPPRVASLATWRSATGEPIDQGIAIHYPAPHSFTGEDVLELQGHGGPVVLQMLLARCVELGARVAEPGEFSRRAFLNDKLDLLQAEAVADLIEASSAQAARSALRSLSGGFSHAIDALQSRLTALRMRVEACLDFPEEEVDAIEFSQAERQLQASRVALDEVRARAKQGSLLRGGLQVVLAGQPNVGKSSLLNRLAGEERAIVTDIAGTTRDALREAIQIEGVPIHVIDTAGLRETGDAIERIGIERSWSEIARADVVLHLLDIRLGWTQDDDVIEAKLPAGIEHIVVANKIDAAEIASFEAWRAGRLWIGLSARTGEGIPLLQHALLRAGGWREGIEDAFLARQRHLDALDRAGRCLDRAQGLLTRTELFAEELRLAQAALSEITGELTPDDLLGEIFSRFCIGK